MKKLFTFIFFLLIFSCNRSQPELNSTIINSETETSGLIEDVDEKKLIGPKTMKGMKGRTNSNVSNEMKQESVAHQSKKVIRIGNISIETKDIKKSKDNIDILLNSYDGYYEQEQTSSGSTYTNYNLKLRIPSESFDNFLQKLESGSDIITEKSIGIEDISIKYYDIESRLKSKRSYLDRYQNMVKSAKSIKELLEIEEQIRQLQEDIESNESLMRNLAGQVAYSTLNIHIFYTEASTSTFYSSIFTKIKESFSTGWNLIEIIFLGLIAIWPILIGIGLLLFAWKKYKRKK